MKRIAILGSALSGGAAQIIEVCKSRNDLLPVFILDRDQMLIGKQVLEVTVKGSTEDILSRWKNKEFDEALIAIGGDLRERERLFNYLIEQSIPLTNIIDPSVRFGFGTSLGVGNVILNNTYIGNYVTIGNNNYILNQCSFQHDSKIGDHNYFGTNVSVGAKVNIGAKNRFGIKSIVETNAKIESNQIIKTAEIIYT